MPQVSSRSANAIAKISLLGLIALVALASAAVLLDHSGDPDRSKNFMGAACFIAPIATGSR